MPKTTEELGDQHAASIAYQQDEQADSPLSEVMERLPSLVGRGLLYLVLLFATVAFAWAALNEVDVIVAVPAQVIPEGKLKVIQPPFPGTVQEIAVRQGNEVRRGDVLIVYESAAVSDLLAELKAAHAELLWPSGISRSPCLARSPPCRTRSPWKSKPTIGAN